MSNGIPVTVARAVEELRKYRHGLKTMSGGFTISGGEPLMQHRFVVKLSPRPGAWASTPRSTPTATSASACRRRLETIDLVLLDIKAWDPERHRRLTGMDVGPTHGVRPPPRRPARPIWVRFVLVPGLTDDPDDIEQIAGFAADLGNVERVDVLPFHQMGRYKWKRLGLDYTLEDVEPPTAECPSERAPCSGRWA